MRFLMLDFDYFNYFNRSIFNGLNGLKSLIPVDWRNARDQKKFFLVPSANALDPNATNPLARIKSILKELFNLITDIIRSLDASAGNIFIRRIFQWLNKTTKTFFNIFIQILYLFNRLIMPKQFIIMFLKHTLALVLLWTIILIWKYFLNGPLLFIRSWLVSFVKGKNFNLIRNQLLLKMDNATTYHAWKKAASSLDRHEDLYAWKNNSNSSIYDFVRIKQDLTRFRELVDKRDIIGIMLYSRSRLVRNLANINDRRLYSHLRSGTKRLIEEYISEVVRALQLVCVVEVPGLTNADKLAFFNECRHAYGRSALLLSGGATLGLYHTGVIKVLFENKLLPKVISGSSVGSIVCAMVGTRTDSELEQIFDPNHIKLDFFPSNFGSVTRKIRRFVSQGVLMDIKILEKCVRANVPNYTFQEAYDRTGRIINIVVSPAASAGNQDNSRLLNYLTAPNVFVWSAALASCAIPGVYAPVELKAKNEFGQEVNYLEGNKVVWEDGSVQSDLPTARLSELFNVNHAIVSQVNPHVVPFLQVTAHESNLNKSSNDLFVPPRLISRLISFLAGQLQSTLMNLSVSGFLPLHTSTTAILAQKYVGDITFVPNLSLIDYKLILTNPTPDRLKFCLRQSEKLTYRMLPRVHSSCEVEFTLDECVHRMRAIMILEEINHERQLLSKAQTSAAQSKPVNQSITQRDQNVDNENQKEKEKKDENNINNDEDNKFKLAMSSALKAGLNNRVLSWSSDQFTAHQTKKINNQYNPNSENNNILSSSIPVPNNDNNKMECIKLGISSMRTVEREIAITEMKRALSTHSDSKGLSLDDNNNKSNPSLSSLSPRVRNRLSGVNPSNVNLSVSEYNENNSSILSHPSMANFLISEAVCPLAFNKINYSPSPSASGNSLSGLSHNNIIPAFRPTMKRMMSLKQIQAVGESTNKATNSNVNNLNSLHNLNNPHNQLDSGTFNNLKSIPSTSSNNSMNNNSNNGNPLIEPDHSSSSEEEAEIEADDHNHNTVPLGSLGPKASPSLVSSQRLQNNNNINLNDPPLLGDSLPHSPNKVLKRSYPVFDNSESDNNWLSNLPGQNLFNNSNHV